MLLCYYSPLSSLKSPQKYLFFLSVGFLTGFLGSFDQGFDYSSTNNPRQILDRYRQNFSKFPSTVWTDVPERWRKVSRKRTLLERFSSRDFGHLAKNCELLWNIPFRKGRKCRKRPLEREVGKTPASFVFLSDEFVAKLLSRKQKQFLDSKYLKLPNSDL